MGREVTGRATIPIFQEIDRVKKQAGEDTFKGFDDEEKRRMRLMLARMVEDDDFERSEKIEALHQGHGRMSRKQRKQWLQAVVNRSQFAHYASDEQPGMNRREERCDNDNNNDITKTKTNDVESDNGIANNTRSHSDDRASSDGTIGADEPGRKANRLRCCAFVDCGKSEPRPKAFLCCGKCKDDGISARSFYCSLECQKADWAMDHRQFHRRDDAKRRMRQRGEEKDGGGGCGGGGNFDVD